MKLEMPLRRKARIEMLPLIDIVFLLLVVFIYAMLSMAVHRGLPVVLPTSSTAGIDKQEFLSITVQSKASQLQPVIYVDDKPVALDELTGALLDKVAAASGEKSAPQGVLLFADSTVNYQQLFRVLDRIRAAGISNISLQAEEVTR